MKKIVALSIVCLVSGQLFAQTNKTTTTTPKPTKEQIEVQKQQETSSLSLKAATDINTAPAEVKKDATPSAARRVKAKPAAKANKKDQ